MKNKNQIAFLIILFAAVFSTLAFVILPTILYGANKQVETPAPDQTVRDFYDWYLSYEGNPLAEKAYRVNAMLSEDFIRQLDEQTTGELIADPLLCAQDVPESVTVSSAEISGPSARVEVQTSAGNRFGVGLVLDENIWKIVEVSCR
jgi:hypothetical protein